MTTVHVANSIHVIFPQKQNGIWIFTDPEVGLVNEPFVSGAGEMIDVLTAGLQGAKDGFAMIFADHEFPGFHVRLDRVEEEAGGNWYRCEQYEMRGWLCPALFKYFDRAPQSIYVKAER